MPDFIPRRDSELVPFSANFTARIAEYAAALHIAPESVAALVEVNDIFQDAYRIASQPGTDSTTAIRGKIDARKALLRVLRPIAARARITATDEQRVKMGLKPRRRGKAPRCPARTRRRH